MEFDQTGSCKDEPLLIPAQSNTRSTLEVELKQVQINSTSTYGLTCLVYKTCLTFLQNRLKITSSILLTLHLHDYHSDHVEPVEIIPEDNKTEQGSCQRFPE